MIDLEEFQRRVDQYFQCGQRSEPQGRIMLDLMRALRERSQEYETLKEAYLRLMQGVEEKMQSTFADCVPGPRKHREPALGPLGMGSAEGGEVVDGPKAPPEWLVWAVDKLRDDYKDGNFHRSYRFAQELLTAIDVIGYAIVPKERRA